MMDYSLMVLLRYLPQIISSSRHSFMMNNSILKETFTSAPQMHEGKLSSICNPVSSTMMRWVGFVCHLKRRQTALLSTSTTYSDERESRSIHNVAIIGEEAWLDYQLRIICSNKGSIRRSRPLQTLQRNLPPLLPRRQFSTQTSSRFGMVRLSRSIQWSIR